MLAQPLITQNIGTLSSALKKSELVTPQLHLIKNIFTQPVLSKLHDYLYWTDLMDQELAPDKRAWQPETTADGIPMVDTPRFKLTFDSDSVIEEIYEICSGITSEIFNLYPYCPKQFKGIVIWKDLPGYSLDWHTDNKDNDINMQIYLEGSEQNPGTEFKVETGSLVVPFVTNTGYVVDHNDISPMHEPAAEISNNNEPRVSNSFKIDHNGNRPVHRVAYPVPAGEVRYSLFAIWKNVF